MNIFLKIVLGILWIVTILGIAVLIFTQFQYVDLNIIVIVLILVTLVNTIFSLKK